MKFKLVEEYTSFDYAEAREFIQEYTYEAIDDLKSAPLEEYQKWFRDTSAYIHECNFDALDAAVKDFYIEAIDSGKIDKEKTMITSQLIDYINEHSDLIDKDIDKLINNCPTHLKHELTLVLDKIDDSLNENKGDTDKRLMVDVINNFNAVKVNVNEYVLHHINGKKEDPRDRVTSNYLLIPIKYNNMSGNEIHLGIHRIARAYKDLDQEVSKFNEIPWLYVGTGNQLTNISAEEVVEKLKKNLQKKINIKIKLIKQQLNIILLLVN